MMIKTIHQVSSVQCLLLPLPACWADLRQQIKDVLVLKSSFKSQSGL